MCALTHNIIAKERAPPQRSDRGIRIKSDLFLSTLGPLGQILHQSGNIS